MLYRRMMACTLMRQFAAMIAAYAIALQAVLAAFAPAPLASADAGIVICRGDDAGAPAMPRTQGSCDACLAGHCAGAATEPARAVVMAFWPVAVARAEITRHAAARAPVVARGPHSPRAPPRV